MLYNQLICNNSYQDHPDLVKDQFWDEERPEMPYTEDTRDLCNKTFCWIIEQGVDVSVSTLH